MMTNKDTQKKYRIYVYFPTDFENLFEDTVNKLFHYLISNERIIFGNAIINTVKKLREAEKLNICLYKNASLIKNKTNPILEKKDINEAYREINNITINTPCYKRLANFYNWLYMNTLGRRKEKGAYKTFIMHNILGKHLSNSTLKTRDNKTIKIRNFVIDAKYDPNLEIYEKNTTTENINKENNEQHMKV